MQNKKKKQTGQTGHEPNNLVREKELKFRVSLEEYRSICERANAQTYNSLAQFMRENLLTLPGELRPLEKKLLRSDAIYEIKRIGVTLNNIVRLAQTTNVLDVGLNEKMKTFKQSLERIYKKM